MLSKSTNVVIKFNRKLWSDYNRNIIIIIIIVIITILTIIIIIIIIITITLITIIFIISNFLLAADCM